MAKQSLAVKYRPLKLEDVVEQDISKQILKYQLDTGTFQHTYLFCGQFGGGKAQPLYSNILTPTGWKKMGNIKVGDTVFTSSGDTARVSGIYPQGVRPIYEITVQDGTKIRVADNHLNVVYRYNIDKKCREDYTLTTLELLDFMESSRFKLRVDTPCVDWPEKPVPIDPYLLGCLIGDGSLTSGNLMFCNEEPDILRKVDVILRRDWNMCLVHKSYHETCEYDIRYVNDPGHCGSRGNKGEHPLVRNYDPMTTLKGVLNSLGLLCKSVDKHIPEEYLYNSRRIRQALLQGLYDTDGSTECSCEGKGASTNFSTSSKQLSENFAFLVRSLGIRDTVRRRKGRYKKDGEWVYVNDTYSHYLKIDNSFCFCTSEKHLSRWKPRQNPPLRNIVSVEYVGDEECQCIYIDHPDHTYISDGFIPTHNTTVGRIFANELNKGVGTPIEMDMASNGGVDSVRSVVQDAHIKPIDGEYKVFILDEVHCTTSAGFSALLKIFEDTPSTAIFILCTTDPQKIPQTILSRVQRFNFTRISTKGIFGRLKYIVECENKEGNNYTYTDDALNYLARMGNGSMRQAISLMDRCLSLNPNLTMENVISCLGTLDYDTYFDLLMYLTTNSHQSAVQLIERVYNEGKDLQQFITNFEYFVIDVCKYKLCNSFDYIDIPNVGGYKQRLDDESYDSDVVVLQWLRGVVVDVKRNSNPRAYITASIMLLEVE